MVIAIFKKKSDDDDDDDDADQDEDEEDRRMSTIMRIRIWMMRMTIMMGSDIHSDRHGYVCFDGVW